MDDIDNDWESFLQNDGNIPNYMSTNYLSKNNTGHSTDNNDSIVNNIDTALRCLR